MSSYCRPRADTQKAKLYNIQSTAIDNLANRYLELNRFSGTIAIQRGQSILYYKHFGLADYEKNESFSDNTSFKIGQLSAIITTTILQRIVSEENIPTSDKVSKYLTDIESNLTIDNLLIMPPELSISRGQINANIAGKLIEQLSSKSFQENIEIYSNDLGLINTYYEKDDSNEATGYLFHNYRGNGLELQPSPSYNLEEAFSALGVKSNALDLLKIIKSRPSESIEYSGYLENDGFTYSLSHETKDKFSIIVLSNRRHPVAKEISSSISAILNGETYTLPLARDPYPLDLALLEEFDGLYQLNENVIFEVIKANDSLFVLFGPNKLALIPQSENQFYMLDNDAAMRFEPDSTGRINRIFLLNGFIDSEEEASRVK